MKKEKLYLWYSPKLNMINIASKESGYLFKNSTGEHHLCYKAIHLFGRTDFIHSEFYLIGEL